MNRKRWCAAALLAAVGLGRLGVGVSSSANKAVYNTVAGLIVADDADMDANDCFDLAAKNGYGQMSIGVYDYECGQITPKGGSIQLHYYYMSSILRVDYSEPKHVLTTRIDDGLKFKAVHQYNVDSNGTIDMNDDPAAKIAKVLVNRTRQYQINPGQ